MEYQPKQAEIPEREAPAQPVADEPVVLGALDARAVLALQRSAGNAAVTARMAAAESSALQRSPPERPAAPAASTSN